MAERPNFAGELYQDRIPDALAEWLVERLGDEATIWGALETGSSRPEGDVWLIASRGRNALAAATKKGRWWKDLPATGETAVEAKFAKRKFLLDGDEVFEAGRLGGGDLVRLFELAFLPRAEGLHRAALDHVEKKAWQPADELLALAQTRLTADDTEQSVAYVNRSQRIAVRRAQCAMELGREGDALEMLAEVSAERSGDDLITATSEMHGISGWLLTLALAHEEAGQPSCAAKVYARLHADSPDQDLYVLSRARALRRAGQFDEAARAFEAFVEGRRTDELSLLPEDAPEEDVDLVDADPDLVAACLESGELLEELEREVEAAQRYLTLLRGAPFAREGYARLFRLRDSLGPDDGFAVTIAGEVLRLLQPELAEELDDLPERHVPIELPYGYATIGQDEHDQRIVHAKEKASGSVAQKWIGSLTSDARDTRDIERHARQVDGSKHPGVYELLAGIAAMLEIEPPRLFLSYGSSGVDVLGVDDPFVLLGACHVDVDDERHLELRQLAFALGGQVEHIKANHLILTSSEFWKTFGTKSATALLAFVPLGDLVGKFTDKSMLAWVGKLRGTSETKMIRSLLDIAEGRLTEGAAREGVQSAYTAALAKVRQVTLDEEKEDKPSMVKEQLADFARCAQYTADRVGLLACDDLSTAIDAMLRLSPTAHRYADRLPAEGLRPLLHDHADESSPNEEVVLRIGELVKFALSDDYGSLRRQIL